MPAPTNPLHLAVALDGAGWHPAAWREPDAQPGRLFTAAYWAGLAQQAERGLLDFITIEDGLDLQSGESAEVAGQRGLRFAANYHVSPATVIEAVEGYRAAFKDTGELSRPYVSVSADVVVADSGARARELAAGYGPWVRSIRTAEGAIQFPTPAEARRYPWTDADRALVADRVDTQFTGTAAQVADQLERLRDATEADELIITTITHDHADRVRSYELLAQEWARR